MLGKTKRKINCFIANHSSIALSVNHVTMPDLYRGKVAAVTGGSGDIGWLIALRMKEAGAKVVITGRNETVLEKRAIEYGMKHVVWDVEQIGSIEEKVKTVFDQYGAIDVWVNCAGYISENDLTGDFWKVTEKDWDKQFDVNCKSLYFITKEVCQCMASVESGGIYHIVQVLSEDGARNTWQPYGISKRVAIEMTKGIAKCVIEKGIVVNGVAPGGVATQMIASKLEPHGNLRKMSSPSHRICSAEEVAQLVCYLGSGMADQMVGNVIEINGGNTL